MDDAPNDGRIAVHFGDGIDAQWPSRRDVLSTAAKLGGGAFALSAVGSGAAAADQHEGDGTDEDVSDVDILNFALTLEHLEYAFYRDALASSGGMFDEARVETGTDISEQYTGGPAQHGLFQRFEDIRDHEEAHVEALTETIEEMGGDPVGEAEYEFGYGNSFNKFVQIASALENTGVAAYAGAAPMIDNPDLIPPALSIHSVEARHASFIDRVGRWDTPSPFPNAFDPAKTMDEVLAAAGQFIVSE